MGLQSRFIAISIQSKILEGSKILARAHPHPPGLRPHGMRGGSASFFAGCDGHEAPSATTPLETLEDFMESMQQPTPELLAKRKAALDRKQRQRAREKARSHQAMVDHLEKLKGDRMNAQHLARRIQRNQCTLGEISPGVDANNLVDALLVAREFGRALSIPDIQEGESLYDFERRVFKWWVKDSKTALRFSHGCVGTP